MLTEFAITPQVFDANAADGNWLRHLNELARGIFPMDRKQPVPVIVSNFHAGRWFEEATSIVERIHSQGKREKAKSFLTKLSQLLVDRPAEGDLPINEEMWIEEALESHRCAPLGRLLVTHDPSEENRWPNGLLCKVASIVDDGFWDGISSPRHPRRVIREQIDEMSSICLHATFLAFVSPHINDSGNDLAFAIELIQRALGRPRTFQTPTIDIHTMVRSSPAPESDHILRGLRAARCGSATVRLLLWPKLLERILIAGSALGDKAGEHRRRARWAVSLTHVARESDRNGGGRNTFTLMRPDIRDELCETLYGTQLNDQWPKVFAVNAES
jgi:hypothetical protein